MATKMTKLFLGVAMSDLRKLVAAAAFGSALMVPSLSSALTTNVVECGVLTAANNVCEQGDDGPYSVNLAAHDTQWRFEGTIGDTSGSLTIHTYTDPYWANGISSANISINALGEYGEEYTANIVWGGDPVYLFEAFESLVSGKVYAQFLNVQDNGIDFVISWENLNGGEALSVVIGAVPLPAGGLLLLTALGGLGIARRRRSGEPVIA